MSEGKNKRNEVTFNPCESYKHKYAKQIVKEWLVNSDRKTIKTTFHDIKFCTNRTIGVWEEYPVTIFKKKYSGCDGLSTIDQLWDETSNYRYDDPSFSLKTTEEAISKLKLNIEIDDIKKINEDIKKMDHIEYEKFKLNNEKWKIRTDINNYINEKYPYFYDTPPIYEESLNYGVTTAVLDLAIACKGYIKYGVEICHTNPVTDEKVKKLQQAHLSNLIEIDADWVLNQTKQPEIIKVKRWLIYDEKICL